METQTFCGACSAPTMGSSALAFDTTRLTSLIKSRNTRFELDLSGRSMIEVLGAHEAFHQKSNPKYKNSAIIAIFQRLQDMIGETIMPEDINDLFWQEFIDFLYTSPNPKTGNVVKPSTARCYCDCIASVLSWAQVHRCTISETFRSYKIDNYDKTKVALTPSQISHIYHYDIDINYNKLRYTAYDMYKINYVTKELFEAVRDHFVLSCQLGQRYSDTKRIDRSNFDSTKTIYKVTQQKTGGKASVNLTRYAIDKDIAFEILNKYNYQAPRLNKDINYTNKILHVLCYCIGGEFLKELPTEYKQRGDMKSEKCEMWKCITTHTARRTFVTYWAQKKEMSIARLQRCTGHKDVRQISRYTILEDD